MKKGLGALLLAVMMVMGIALLTGCSPQNPLVGTWQLTYDGATRSIPQMCFSHLTRTANGRLGEKQQTVKCILMNNHLAANIRPQKM